MGAHPSFSTTGPSVPYTPETTDTSDNSVAGTVIPSVIAKGPALAALALESGGNLAAILAKLTSDPATQTTLASVLAKLSSDPATQTTLAALLAKTTADPATGTGQAAMTAKLTSILTALQAQLDLADLFVTDGTSFYVRRESLNEGTGAITVAFLNIDGTTPNPAPVVANLHPITSSGGSSSAIVVETAFYDVVTAATSYAIGDVLARVLFVNTATQTIAGSSWQNLTQGTTLGSAPAAANIAEQTKNVVVGASALPAGASTAAKQPAIGVAGTPAADVLTIQGNPSGTPVPADTVVRGAAVNRGGLTQGGASATAIAAGGSGAVVGDVITLAGGTLAPGGLATQLTVSSVSSGAITGVAISRQGAYVAAPISPVAQGSTSGAGTGATFTMTYAPISFQVMPANASRRGIKLKIPVSSTGTFWFSASATTTPDYNSFDMAPGDYYASDPHEVGTAAITAIGSAIGLPFYGREF